jgi:hypothetical protein
MGRRLGIRGCSTGPRASPPASTPAVGWRPGTRRGSGAWSSPPAHVIRSATALRALRLGQAHNLPPPFCCSLTAPRLTVSTTSCNVTRHTQSNHPRPRSSPSPLPCHRHGRACPGSRALPAAAAPTARHRHRVRLMAPAAAASVLLAAISMNACEQASAGT